MRGVLSSTFPGITLLNHRMMAHRRSSAASAAAAAPQDPPKAKRARATRSLQMEEAELFPCTAVASGVQGEKADNSTSTSSNSNSNSNSVSSTVKGTAGGLKEPTPKRRRSSTTSSRRSSISVPVDDRPEARLCKFFSLFLSFAAFVLRWGIHFLVLHLLYLYLMKM